MDLQTYLQEVQKTWNTEPQHKYQVANAAMGMVGELGEASADLSADELGDVYYYTAILATLLSKEELLDNSPPRDKRVWGAIRKATLHNGLEILELAKKYTFHSTDEESRKGYAQKLSVPLIRFHDNLIALIRYVGADPEEVRENNIRKLTERHPDGWKGGKEVSS